MVPERIFGKQLIPWLINQQKDKERRGVDYDIDTLKPPFAEFIERKKKENEEEEVTQ